jgi:hypothetical protein
MFLILANSLTFANLFWDLGESAEAQAVKLCYPLAAMTPPILWNCCK